MEIRAARPAELAAVMTVLDSGGLEVPVDRLRAALSHDRVLVAAEDRRVLGVVVIRPHEGAGPAEIDAIAVRPGRRRQGIGTTLVRAVADRHEALMAAFDERVQPFWVSLGFAIEPAAEPDRYRGRLDDAPAAE